MVHKTNGLLRARCHRISLNRFFDYISILGICPSSSKFVQINLLPDYGVRTNKTIQRTPIR